MPDPERLTALHAVRTHGSVVQHTPPDAGDRHRRLAGPWCAPPAVPGRTEPAGPGDRPIGMVLTTVRRAVPATVLAAALVMLCAGCGGPSGSGEPDDDVPGSAAGSSPGSATAARSPGRDGGAAERVVFFSAAPRGPGDGHQVLHDRAETDRYAAAFAAGDPQAQARIADAGRTTDFTRQVLVGWTATTGCSAATAAALTVSGDRLELHVTQPEPPRECLVAFHVSVVFQVAKERMPAQPVFG